MQAVCPACGFPNEISREEYLILFDLPHEPSILERKIIERGGVSRPACAVCGEDLTEAFRAAVVPSECLSERIVCGYPCGRKDDPFREDALPCSTMVKLADL